MNHSGGDSVATVNRFKSIGMSSVTDWVNGFLLSASHSPSLSGSYFPACPCPALRHFLPNIHSHNTAYSGNDRHLQNIITHSEWSLFSQTKEVSTAVLWTLSLWLLRTAVETVHAIVREHLRPLFWRRSTASSVFRVGARGRAFTLSPPPAPPLPAPLPVPKKPPRFCGHKAECLLTYKTD